MGGNHNVEKFILVEPVGFAQIFIVVTYQFSAFCHFFERCDCVVEYYAFAEQIFDATHGVFRLVVHRKRYVAPYKDCDFVAFNGIFYFVCACKFDNVFFNLFRLGNVLLHGVETHSVCKRRDFKLAKLCSDFTAIHRRKSNVFESALDGNVAVDSDKLFAQKRKLFVVLNILSQFAGNIACVFQDAFKRAVFVQKLLRRFFAHSGNTRHVVRRISSQCFVIYKLLNGKSVLQKACHVVHFDVADAFFCPKNFCRRAYKLEAVAISRDYDTFVVETL